MEFGKRLRLKHAKRKFEDLAVKDDQAMLESV